MRAAKAGDGVAFAALYGRHDRRLLACCRRLLGDPFLAEEVAQQAALEALVSLPRLAVPERFGAWLLAIATHLCRRRLRSPAHRLASLDLLREVGTLREPEAPDPEPERVVEAAELAKALAFALARLPTGQRKAITLFYLRGLTMAETAAALGIEAGAVKARLHKGRLALRRRLQTERAVIDVVAGRAPPQPHD